MSYILGLLRMLSQALNSHNIYNPSIATSNLHLLVVSEYTPNVVLALRTLRHFNFEGIILICVIKLI